MQEDLKIKNDNENKKSKSPLWLKILKFTGWTIFAIVASVVLLCTLAVWILTPAQLTPLVERTATDYLDADVKIKKVELTFWHTFPKMTLDIDSVSVVSRSLNNLPDSIRMTLPPDVDSLLSVGRFHGGINIAALPLGKIALYDLIIENPNVNLVKINDNSANYLIVPQSDEKTDSSTTVIPDITINRFSITGAYPVRYRSLNDSVDVEIYLNDIDFRGADRPDYRLTVKAEGRSPMLGNFNLDNLPVNLDGKISWSPEVPDALSINRFTIQADSLTAEFSTDISYDEAIRFNTFEIELKDCSASYLLSLIPDRLSDLGNETETDMRFTIKAKLSEPYVYDITDTVTSIPSLRAEIDIPPCHLKWKQLNLNKFRLAANADIDGDSLDLSVLNIDDFEVSGKSIKFDMAGKIKTPLSDPFVDANMTANIDFSMLPDLLIHKFASTLTGKVSADVSLRMHRSDLSPNRFHKLKVKGDIDLDDFKFVSLDSITRATAKGGCFQFGTNMKFINDNRPAVDSLLTASIKIDSASVISGPITLTASALKAGIGTRLTAERPDSSTLVPFGGLISFTRFTVDDRNDSIRLRLRDVSCRASLTRFEGIKNSPLLALNFDAGRIFGNERRNFVGLTKGHADLRLHLRKRNRPQLTDSARMAMRRRNTDVNKSSDLDIEVDSGLKAALQRWDLRGSLKAEQGRFITPALPVMNRLSNVDLRFSTDSVTLTDLNYRMGHSDFIVNGCVSNIRRALSRRRNNTLKVNFTVKSDTIDINQISRLLMSGGATFADTGNFGSEDEIPDEMPKEIESDDSVSTAFIVPANLSANLIVKAENVIYTDLVLNDFSGQVLVENSAVNLHNLSASTDIGSLNLTALYSAPDKKDIQFGLGLKIDKFHLDKMTALVPAIDTLMPMLHDFSGIINADIAATSQIDSSMNFVMPTLQAAIKLSGDSLVLLDADTFKSLSKWLMFKNKKHNMIDKMSVEMVIDNSTLEIFPFIFDIDRYKLGVMGSNDLAMNLNYHISVLKSPMPFKFGINIKGNVDDMKIRLGGAKFKGNNVIERVSIADTTRINLVNQIENVFRRSARTRLSLNRRKISNDMSIEPDMISAEDSAMMIKEGFIDAPATPDTTAVK